MYSHLTNFLFFPVANGRIAAWPVEHHLQTGFVTWLWVKTAVQWWTPSWSVSKRQDHRLVNRHPPKTWILFWPTANFLATSKGGPISVLYVDSKKHPKPKQTFENPKNIKHIQINHPNAMLLVCLFWFVFFRQVQAWMDRCSPQKTSKSCGPWRPLWTRRSPSCGLTDFLCTLRKSEIFI